jgi:hypothetical protein
MPNYQRMSLAQLLKTVTMTPRGKHRASEKHAISRRGLAQRKAKSQLVDPAKHGTVLSTPYHKGQLAAPLIAARWIGQDFLVTVPWYIKPWRDWPAGEVDMQRFVRDMRQGARVLSTLALRSIHSDEDFGFDIQTRPWLPGLKPHLESLALVRIVPERGKFFEEDSNIHWGHHMRDGQYDVFAGMKLDKNKRPIWLGQDADDNNKDGFVPFQYNQIRADGHGVAFVFRFKREFVETRLLTG